MSHDIHPIEHLRSACKHSYMYEKQHLAWAKDCSEQLERFATTPPSAYILPISTRIRTKLTPRPG